MKLHGLLWQLAALKFLLGICAGAAIGSDERRCKYQRVNKLLKIRCHDMNLKEVPQYLKTSIEIMDLSFNRIKKLKRSSFQSYGSLRFLLLYENMIQSVEPGTFIHLSDLQEIDLSNNALMTIPLELFQLPSLRNLYVDSNDLINFPFEQEALEIPIRAPLEYLNVADCSLQDLPQLGPLPKLWHLNISMNPLEDLNLERLADLCNLRSIDITHTKVSNCHCQQLNNHLKAIQVDTKFAPVCLEVLDIQQCPLPYNQTIGSESFRQCKATIPQAEARSARLIWGGSILSVILLLLVIIYCVYKKRRRHRKRRLQAKAAQRKNLVIAPKNGIHLPAKDSSPSDHTHLPQRDLLSCNDMS